MGVNTKIVLTATGKFKYFVDGQEVSRAKWDKLFPPKKWSAPKVTGNHAGWPRVSRALSVHPKQAGQLRDILKAHGHDPAQVRNDGKLEIRSQKQQREFVKLFNRNRGKDAQIADYGD